MSENIDTSEEKLDAPIDSEVEQVAKEILAAKSSANYKESAMILSGLTNPSDIALSSADPDTGSDLEKVKKSVRDLFILYLTNQFVNRAVNVRADTLISRGYRIISGDEKGRKLCSELIENSGGINLFWQLSVNTDIAGDGFNEKIYNKSKNKIMRLKHVHPLTLRFKKNLTTNKILVDEKGNPKSYEQIYTNDKGTEETKDVPIDVVEHLRFNTLGDEFTGISSLQAGYSTIVRLMNMEYAAAQSAVKIANPIIVGTANSKSPAQIAQWGQILGKISGRDQVFIPEGMTLSILAPGAQNFTEYADYFLNAVVATFGVPRAMLLGESGGGNRAEGIVLQRHFYSVIRSNQRYMAEYFNKIFKEYGNLANFEAPILDFPDVAEDADVNAKSAIDLFSSGIINRDEARMMIGLDADDEGKKVELGTSVTEEIKKSDMDTWHPESPGKAKGSQSGVKKKQKIDKTSEVSPFTE